MRKITRYQTDYLGDQTFSSERNARNAIANAVEVNLRHMAKTMLRDLPLSELYLPSSRPPLTESALEKWTEQAEGIIKNNLHGHMGALAKMHSGLMELETGVEEDEDEDE